VAAISKAKGLMCVCRHLAQAGARHFTRPLCARETRELHQLHKSSCFRRTPVAIPKQSFALDPAHRRLLAHLAMRAPCHTLAAVHAGFATIASSDQIAARVVEGAAASVYLPTAVPIALSFRALAGDSAPQDIAIAGCRRIEPFVETPTSQIKS